MSGGPGPRGRVATRYIGVTTRPEHPTHVYCPRCGSPRGFWCVTKGGQSIMRPDRQHGARQELAVARLMHLQASTRGAK